MTRPARATTTSATFPTAACVSTPGAGGYNLTHRARQVSEADFDRFDLIVGMDASNLRNLRSLSPTPEAEKKIVPMADFFRIATRYDYVPDPYYEGAEGFELVLDLLEDGCRNLYEQLK